MTKKVDKQKCCGKVKHELRFTSSNLRVASSNSRVTSSNPRVTSSNPRVTSSNSWVTSSNSRATSSNSQVGSLKAPVGRLKARVRRLKVRVEAIKHSEFKILNFTSYKKFYFHCLANARLKPHTEVLKNLFHNMALKKHIWPLYCNHILATGKLRSNDSNKT